MLEQTEFVQRLQNSQVEGGTANPATGKSQTDAIDRSVANPRLSGRARRCDVYFVRRPCVPVVSLRQEFVFFLE